MLADKLADPTAPTTPTTTPTTTTPPLKMAKRLLRTSLRTSLATLTPTQIESQSKTITASLLLHPAYTSAHTLSIYLSKPSSPEIQTLEILHHALESGKKCYIPRCISRTHMEMVRVRSMTEVLALPVNRMGIREPALCEARETAFGETGDGIDLVIMPLLGYDSEGWRIGHGGGYYDRFLEECDVFNKGQGRGKVTRTIAVGLKEQLVDGLVPRDEFDRKPDEILRGDPY
ncbi:hypothetical protein HDU98_000412 [Podochytrium sp. JEL0797]|nr:hypothetical protein HDU98_000412 [Podochytrium sp. JEL0797]